MLKMRLRRLTIYPKSQPTKPKAQAILLDPGNSSKCMRRQVESTYIILTKMILSSVIIRHEVSRWRCSRVSDSQPHRP